VVVDCLIVCIVSCHPVFAQWLESSTEAETKMIAQLAAGTDKGSSCQVEGRKGSSEIKQK
jgi:hypothetical protein